MRPCLKWLTPWSKICDIEQSNGAFISSYQRRERTAYVFDIRAIQALKCKLVKDTKPHCAGLVILHKFCAYHAPTEWFSMMKWES